MSIDNDQLDAFFAVARFGSVSKAAKQLGITQSATSHRLRKLEDYLHTTLFNRNSKGLTLTAAGQSLWNFAKSRQKLENDFLSLLAQTTNNDISGHIKIAAYSSVLRSVLIPALTPLMHKYRNIRCEFICKHIKELPDALFRDDIDFVVLDYVLVHPQLKAIKLGQESYVVIESKKQDTSKISAIYLDNAPDDPTTENFFRSQASPLPNYQRMYFSDCYGILDGVEAGLGRAIMPKHLLEKRKGVKIIGGYKPYHLDVTLHYYNHTYQSKLHKMVIKELVENCKNLLMPA